MAGGATNKKAPSKAVEAKRAVRFPNPTGALRQHVAMVEAATSPPPGIRVRPAALPLETSGVAPETRAREIVRQLQATGLARRQEGPPSPILALRSSEVLDDPPSLGSQVRALRRARDLTQAQLARRAGVGRRFIIDLEGGKAGVELGLVLQVLRALGGALRLEVADHG